MDVTVTGATATREGDTLKIEYPVIKDKNDRIPDWAINPGIGGVVGAVGMASKRQLGTREQVEEARLAARLELGAMLEMRVQSVGRNELEERFNSTASGRSEDSRKNMLGVDRDILDVVLSGTRQRALWFDPEDGECYVWMVLDGRLLEAADHHVAEKVSIFIATQRVTNEYRPVRRKPIVPQVVVEARKPAPVAPKVEPPKEPVEKLESNLNPIQTVPIKDPKSGAQAPPK